MKTHLVVHHSLTRDSETVSWQAIRRYHKSKGWIDVGYHYGVEGISGEYEMLVGRPVLSRAAAAHEAGMNRLGVHVCFVGNFDDGPPPEKMLSFAIPHLTDICEALRIPIDREHVIGHREVAPYKTCPGSQFDLDLFVERLQARR